VASSRGVSMARPCTAVWGRVGQPRHAAAHDGGVLRWRRLRDGRGWAPEERRRPAVGRAAMGRAAAAVGRGRWWLGFSNVGPRGLLFGLLLGYSCLRKNLPEGRYIGFLPKREKEHFNLFLIGFRDAFLYYKERRQLKTFLTQFGPALPLTQDPPVRLRDD
jgi:hypothetical protein